ncbi:hypothetical protein LOY85_04265 [Brevibacillus brevis]|uniref:hypothetical protein n=1 Tax=Brevibacillus brevis TaxID=1393 RepID=UPI001F347BC0|nr:hypothetical protein [Brevibacillus brevis]UIO43381.1 hypothetical protein LOY85_04265 [Brevibacillus brevis]
MGVSDCNLFGNHKMEPQGRAIIKNKNTGKTINAHWTYYKCKCRDFFACSGAPQLGEPIFDYLTNHYLNAAAMSGIVTVHVDPSNISNTSKSTIPGHRFMW